MFCVVYEFKVKKGHALQFEESWGLYTEAIHRVRGSFGSRLHKTENPLIYVAYAQWPSKELFDSPVSPESYTEAEQNQRRIMNDSLESTEKVYELHMCDDHLRINK